MLNFFRTRERYIFFPSKFTDRVGGNVYEKYKECKVKCIGVLTVKYYISYLLHRIVLNSPWSIPVLFLSIIKFKKYRKKYFPKH